jgi:heat shock protein 1/8
MDEVAIGIDLGTTNSCAAYYSNGKVEIIDNKEGTRITPSFLYFMEKNITIVGCYAQRMANSKPEYGVYEIKRLIGRKFDDPHVQNNLKYFSFKVESDSNDPVVVIEQQNQTVKKTPLDLCAAILSKIKTDAEFKLKKSVDKAVITVPAYFNITQREATLAAANKAGFTVLKLLNEPTAAALSYYLENSWEIDNHSLVYDLGGGTFDVAILKQNKNNIDIVCVDGDTHLGGQDFDNLIIDYVCNRLESHYKFNPRQERRTMRRLQYHCEEAKKILSVAEETTIVLHGVLQDNCVIEIPLTRNQFERMAQSYFQKTIDIIDNCLKSCNLPKTAIKEVILSGGSTRIPKIQKMLSDYFEGKNLNKFVNPDECVAEGAALQAAMLSKNPTQVIKGIQISDVAPLSLGVRNFVDLMTILIKRNTPIPATASSTRVTVYNQQKSMGFQIYEGERLNARMNHCLGKLTIMDITPAPPGQCQVTFAMSIDNNGILTVTAKEKYRNNVKDLKIVYTRGHRSDSEVKNAVKDAADHKDDDEEFKVFAAYKEYLLDYCIRVMYNFENKNLVTSHKEAYDFCKEIKNIGEKTTVRDKGEVLQMIQDVEARCKTIVKAHNFDYMPQLCL